MAEKNVKVIECPRDAWQGLPRQISGKVKADYLRALIEAGFRHIDAVSFVSPKAVPQMADSEDVLEKLDPPDGIEIIGIVVNEKGAERAIATDKVSTLGYPCSISETFLQRNQKQSPQENRDALQRIKARADAARLATVAYISMAFGNPYHDPWNEEVVMSAAMMIERVGIRAISLADTVGMAEPELIERVVAAVVRECPQCEIGVHLHSTRANAAKKVLAAYDAGCRRFDSAVGGLGGCPFAQDDLVGNIPTEEVMRALEQRSVKTELELESVLALNSEISREFAAD